MKMFRWLLAINTGEIGYELDDKQPVKSAFDTFAKRVDKLLGWIKDSEQFFKDFIDEDVNDMIWRSVVEECQRREIV